MTQPSPRAPLQPMQPLLPYTPMQPMQRLVPMQPLTPLSPGERRQPVPAQAVPAPPMSYRQVPAYLPPSPPAPMFEQLPPPPPPQPQVVNLGLSQSPVITNWGGTPRPPRVPTQIRRPSGGNKAAGWIVGIVAVLIAMGAGGVFSTSPSHTSDVIAVPSIAVSIPPVSIGGKAPVPAQQQPAKTGSNAGASQATPHSGRTLSLNGTISGERIRVTFTRFANNASSKDTFFGPGAGKRYVAAQFQITNTGSVQYVDSPANGARVIDTKGHEYRTTFLVSKLRQGKVFDAAVSLKPGRTAVGYLVFEVPKRAKIRQVQFAENSGFGDKATWTFLKS